jgi:hypothetical protein
MPPRLQSILSVLLAPFLPLLALFIIASTADACTHPRYTDVGVPVGGYDFLTPILLYIAISLGGLWMLWRLTGAGRLAQIFGLLAFFGVNFLMFLLSGDPRPIPRN